MGCSPLYYPSLIGVIVGVLYSLWRTVSNYKEERPKLWLTLQFETCKAGGLERRTRGRS